MAEIEKFEIRDGDVLLIKPKTEISDVKLYQITSEFKQFLQDANIKARIAIMPYDIDVMIIRQKNE